MPASSWQRSAGDGVDAEGSEDSAVPEGAVVNKGVALSSAPDGGVKVGNEPCSGVILLLQADRMKKIVNPAARLFFNSGLLLNGFLGL